MIIHLCANTWVRGLVYGAQHHFQQYISQSWQSVLLVEETGVPGENHRPATSR
jgi:hypothetical protein